MANIDNLNFGIHLDTKDFDARIQATLKTAKEMNVSLTQMLDLQKKVKPVKINLTDIKKQGELERQNIRTKAEEERQNLRTEAAQRRYNKSVSDGNKSLKEANSLMKGRVGWMGQIKNQLLGATSIYAAQRVLREMVNITGEFEKQRMALRAIVQDVDGADGLYDKLQGLALESPFSFKELLSYSKQLSAFSVPLNELYDTTKMLADVSAGLGVSMDRIVLAYGQVRSAEFLRGCLGYDTDIQLFDGDIKKVQDIVVGDELINENGEKVNVLELIRGRETMYIINQTNMSDRTMFKVNENHILTLWNVPDQKLEDVYLLDYLKKPDWYLGVKIKDGERIYYTFDVIKCKEDNYYGFVLDGNKRFLLGDGTVTHNTEVRQFTEAGIPILDELAKQFTELEGRAVSVGEVFDKISARQVPFEMVEKAFVDMTSAGGKFYQMQEVLAETLSGKISNLRDAYEKMFSEIGNNNMGILKNGVDLAASLATNYERVGRVLASMVISYGAYRAALAATIPLQKLNLQLHLAAMSGIKTFPAMLSLVGDKLKSIFAALAKNPFGLTVAVLGTLVTILMTIKNRTELLAEAEEEYRKKLEEVAEAEKKRRDEAERFVRVASDEAASTELRKEALAELNKAYPEILANYDTEYEKLKNIKQIKEEIAAFEKQREQQIIDDELATIEARIGQLRQIEKTFIESKSRGYGGLSRKQYAELEMLENRRNEIYAQRRKESADAFFANLTGVTNEELEAMIEERKNLLDRMNMYKQEEGAVTTGFAGTFSTKEIQAQMNLLYSELNKRKAPKDSSADWIEAAKQRYEAALKEYNDFIQSTNNDLSKEEFEERAKKLKAAVDFAKSEYDAYKVIEEKTKGGKDNKNPFQSYIDGLQAYIDKYEVYKQLVDEGFDKDLAYSLGFGLNAKDSTNIEAEIDKVFSQALSKQISLDYGLKSAPITEQLVSLGASQEEIKNLQGAITEATKQRQTYIDAEVEAYRKQVEFAKEIQKLAGENRTIEEQITALEQKKIDIQNSSLNTQEEKDRAIAQTQEEIDKLRDSLLKIQSIDLSEFWQGLTDVSVNTKLKDIWEYIDQLKELQKLIDTMDVKELYSKDRGTFQGVRITREQAKSFGLSDNFITSLFGDKNELELTKANLKAIREEVDKLNGVATDKSGIVNFFKLLKEGGADTETLKEAASAAIDDVLELSGAFEELGKALGLDIDLSFLDDIGGIAKSALSGDWIGVASQTISMIAGIISETREANRLAEQLAYESARAAKYARDAAELEAFETIFGTDALGQMRAQARLAKEYSGELERMKRTLGSGISSDNRSGWQKFWGTRRNNIVGLNDFLEANGGLNLDNLQVYYDAYADGMSEENRQLVENMIEQWEQYENAMEGVATYMESIFGQVADDIADKFITAFMESGDAATDLGEVVSNVAQQIAKDLIKATLIDNIFTDDKKKQMAEDLASGDTDKVLQEFDTLVENAEELSPHITELLQGLSTYINAGESAGTEDLTNGIKGITEDTASLIASYINAIKADGSVAKSQRERIIQAILSLNFSSTTPNLEDYLNGIRAHTADIAESNRAILERIDRVMTPDDGGAIKVMNLNV